MSRGARAITHQQRAIKALNVGAFKAPAGTRFPDAKVLVFTMPTAVYETRPERLDSYTQSPELQAVLWKYVAVFQVLLRVCSYLNDESEFERAIPRSKHPRTQTWLRDKTAMEAQKALYARRKDVRAYATIEYVCEHTEECSACGAPAPPLVDPGAPLWPAARTIRLLIELRNDPNLELFSRMIDDVCAFNVVGVTDAAEAETRRKSAGRMGVSGGTSDAAATLAVSWLSLDRTVHSLPAFLALVGACIGQDLLRPFGSTYDIDRFLLPPSNEENPAHPALIFSPLAHIERLQNVPRDGHYMDCRQVRYSAYAPRGIGQVYNFPLPSRAFRIPTDSLSPALFHQYANPFTQDVMVRSVVLGRLAAAEGADVAVLHERIAAAEAEALEAPPAVDEWDQDVLMAVINPLRADAGGAPLDGAAAYRVTTVRAVAARYARGALDAAATLPISLQFRGMDYGAEAHIKETNGRALARAWDLFLEDGDTLALLGARHQALRVTIAHVFKASALKDECYMYYLALEEAAREPALFPRRVPTPPGSLLPAGRLVLDAFRLAETAFAMVNQHATYAVMWYSALASSNISNGMHHHVLYGGPTGVGKSYNMRAVLDSITPGVANSVSRKTKRADSHPDHILRAVNVYDDAGPNFWGDPKKEPEELAEAKNTIGSAEFNMQEMVRETDPATGAVTRVRRKISRKEESSILSNSNDIPVDPALRDRFLIIQPISNPRKDGRTSQTVGNDLALGSPAWRAAAARQRLVCTLVGFLNFCINTGALPDIYLGFAARWWEGFVAAMRRAYPGTRNSKRAATRFMHIVRALCLRHIVAVLWEDASLNVAGARFEMTDAMAALPWGWISEEMCIAAAGGSVWDLINVVEWQVVEALRRALGHVDRAMLVLEGNIPDPHYSAAPSASKADIVRSVLAHCNGSEKLSEGDVYAVFSGWETSSIPNGTPLDSLNFPIECAPEGEPGAPWVAAATNAKRREALRAHPARFNGAVSRGGAGGDAAGEAVHDMDLVDPVAAPRARSHDEANLRKMFVARTAAGTSVLVFSNLLLYQQAAVDVQGIFTAAFRANMSPFTPVGRTCTMLGAAGAPQLPLVVEMGPNPAATPWVVYDAAGIGGSDAALGAAAGSTTRELVMDDSMDMCAIRMHMVLNGLPQSGLLYYGGTFRASMRDTTPTRIRAYWSLAAAPAAPKLRFPEDFENSGIRRSLTNMKTVAVVDEGDTSLDAVPAPEGGFLDDEQMPAAAAGPGVPGGAGRPIRRGHWGAEDALGAAFDAAAIG